MTEIGNYRFMRTSASNWYAHKPNRELVNIRNKFEYKLREYKGRAKNIKKT
jgi:hypothetical protein